MRAPKRRSAKGPFRELVVTMLLALFVGACFPSLAGARDADRVHHVVAGESGYEIPVRVMNMGSEPIVSVAVTVAERPPGLVGFHVTPSRVATLAPREVATFLVGFDVAADASTRELAEIVLAVASADADFDQPRPRVAVAIDRGEEVAEDAVHGGAAPAVLKLIRVDWGGTRNTGVTHAPGETGYSVLWTTPKGTVERYSYGFSRFPLEIPLGEPFELVVDLAAQKQEPAGAPADAVARGEAFHHVCSMIGEVWTQPLVDLGVAASANIENFDPVHYQLFAGLRGEVERFRCPSGDYDAAVTVSRSSTFTLGFAPAGPPSVTQGGVYHAYDYRLETAGTDMVPASVEELRGKNVRITFHTELRNTNGLTVSLQSAGGGSTGPVALVYGTETADQPAIQPQPFDSPIEISGTSASGGGRPGTGPGAGRGEPSAEGERPGTEVSPRAERERGDRPDAEAGRARPGARVGGAEMAGGEAPGVAIAGVVPSDRDISAWIREWIGVAEPPENATLGADLRYNHRGRKVGTVPGGRIEHREAANLPFDPTYLWAEHRLADSVDHCTMEEFVRARLAGDSIAHCAGRYVRTVAVPGVEGAEVAAAVRDLRAQGFEAAPALLGPAPSRDLERRVVEQRPIRSTRLAPGSVVEIDVYGDYEEPLLVVPDVTGLTLAAARSDLTRAGLDLQPELLGPAPSPALAGRVVSQRPAVTARVPSGTAVELDVYAEFEAPGTPVPDVRGLTPAEAKRRLTIAGLDTRPLLLGAAPDAARATRVTTQKPLPGATVAPGDAVEISFWGAYEPASEHRTGRDVVAETRVETRRGENERGANERETRDTGTRETGPRETRVREADRPRPARWVLAETLINPNNEPTEFIVGVTPYYYSARMNGSYVRWSISERNMTFRSMWQDHGNLEYDVAIGVDFTAPPADLVPGETVRLPVSFTHRGVVHVGNPGFAFEYRGEGLTLTGPAVLNYGPYSPQYQGVSSMSPSFVVPELHSGEIRLTAFVWNCGACNVAWVYRPSQGGP